ncbi:MAG: PEP-CTERM sorting domain-containing protein [Pirellulaceae bacterium]|nr:PEP-CTERM sorting domain-containing protein [Pirellulaceae bacterium]
MSHSTTRITHWYVFAALSWLAFGLATKGLHADLVVVQNSSFEDVTGSVAFNEFTFGPPVGWQLHNPNGVVVNNGVGPQFWVGTLRPSPPTNFNSVPDGQRVAILFNEFGTGNLGEYGLSQTLTTTLQANMRYTLDVEIGNIASGTALNGQFFNLNGFPGYRVDLLAGGVVIASDNNSLAGSIPEGEWGTSTINFETTASHLQLGQALGIRLVNLNVVDLSAPTTDLEVDFDHVRLQASAVPEPSSGVLLGVLLLFTTFPRRQRKTSVRMI